MVVISGKQRLQNRVNKEIGAEVSLPTSGGCHRTNKIIFYITIGLLMTTGCVSNKLAATNAVGDKITIEAVCEEIINTPEEEINLGRYAMLLTKTVHPEMLFDYELWKLDKMADDIRPRLKNLTAPQDIVNALNEYFFEELGFDGEPTPNGKQNYYLLHYALWRKRAHCVTIGIIYLCLAERLNLPIYGVIVPGHLFLRYDDGKTKINIDTSYKKGQNISNAEYSKIFHPSLTESNASRYGFLINMTKKMYWRSI
jgi:hypothetical protein